MLGIKGHQSWQEQDYVARKLLQVRMELATIIPGSQGQLWVLYTLPQSISQLKTSTRTNQLRKKYHKYTGLLVSIGSGPQDIAIANNLSQDQICQETKMLYTKGHWRVEQVGSQVTRSPRTEQLRKEYFWYTGSVLSIVSRTTINSLGTKLHQLKIAKQTISPGMQDHQ